MLGIRRQLRAAGRRIRNRLLPRQVPIILMYHRIARPAYDPWGLSVSPEHFSDQLNWLKRSRRLVHVDCLVERLRSGKLVGDEIAITFDDGYLDNLRAAKPVLEREQAPATVFITTGRLGAEREFWWDELSQLCLAGTTAIEATLEIAGQSLNVALPARAATDTRAWFWSEPPPSARERTYLMLWKALQRLDEESRDTGMQALRRALGEPIVDAANLPMRRADVAELTAGGLIRVGGHALTHLALTTLSADAKRLQLMQCKRELEELTSGPISGFAYPFGDRDDEVKALTRAVGYDWAVSTHSAVVRSRRSDPFDLPRFQVMDWTGSELMQKLSELRLSS